MRTIEHLAGRDAAYPVVSAVLSPFSRGSRERRRYSAAPVIPWIRVTIRSASSSEIGIISFVRSPRS